MNSITRLSDGSAFFVAEICEPPYNPVHWNAGNKVVHDHRDGTIIQPDTDRERALRGLPVPWLPEYAEREVALPDIQ